MYLGMFDPTIIILIPAIVFTIYAQSKVNSAYNRYTAVRNRKEITGAQAARRILDSNGLQNVPIEVSKRRLSDHYDPRKKVMRLSPQVYSDPSIAAVSIAAHEAGHAIIAETLSELDPVHSISIIPTGMAGGYTMHLPGEEKMYMTKTHMEQEIVGLLGGRAAEEVIFNDITTGASNDIERATAIARGMVTKYGMSSILGPIQFGSESDEVFIGRELAHSRNYGENVATAIDSEVSKIISGAYARAVEILKEKAEMLHITAKVLVEREKLTGDEFRALLNGDTLQTAE